MGFPHFLKFLLFHVHTVVSIYLRDSQTPAEHEDLDLCVSDKTFSDVTDKKPEYIQNIKITNEQGRLTIGRHVQPDGPQG